MNSLSKVVACLASVFPFIRRFSDRITGMITCVDRVIFKGYLPICHQAGIEGFVDHALKMRRMDFLKFAEAQSKKVVAYAQSRCAATGATYQVLKGQPRKEALVHELLRKRGITEGLVCVLAVMECCPSFRLIYGQGRPQLQPSQRLQRVLYWYFLDPQFGLIHVRMSTWFPLTIQVYMNGHSWLARQLGKAKRRFVQHDNAFLSLDDSRIAQKLADQFVELDWPKILSRLAREVNPLMRDLWFRNLSYYWVTDQAEIATDVLFASRNKLAEIFPALLETAGRFSPGDILRYLGRRLHWKFDGEVITDCKTDRLPGARIKHRMKNNWLKMYDKFGQVLRVETVINNPREFRVRRTCTRKGRKVKAYVPMAKGVCNLRHYLHVGKGANLRYLDALAAVEAPRTAGKDLQLLAARRQHDGRSYAGFSPVDADDVRLMKAVLNGNHLLNGFRNKDVRTELYRATTDPAQRRRHAAATGRRLRRLHLRGLLAHIPRTRRWRLTRIGQQLLQSAIHLHDHGIPNPFATAI